MGYTTTNWFDKVKDIFNDAAISRFFFLRIFPKAIIDMIFRKISRKIAVIGTSRSGKTVFLTSLINHLEEHNKMDFVIKNKAGEYANLSDFVEKYIPKYIKGDKFQYKAYRDALVRDRHWPRKTTDTSHYICDYKRSDWKHFRNELHLFDMPGERFADVAIAQFKDFGEWSDYMIEYFKSDAIYHQLAEEYLRLQEEDSNKHLNFMKRLIKGAFILDEVEVLRAYRKSLAQFVLHYKPMVSPSTFLLDQKGGTPVSVSGNDFLNEAQNRSLGLPPLNGQHREFAPLSKMVRDNNKQMTKLFAKNYKAYRKQVIIPLFADLKSSKRLIILVDIPSLLNGGVAMYNDNREILENVFNALSPELLMWRIITNAVKIDRVAFVATKCDSIHPCDLADGKLMRLLEQMTRKFSDRLNHDVKKQSFVCSAVVSAKAAEGDYMMRGTLVNSDNFDKEHVFKVSKLPSGWPTDWKHGDYRFPSVLPRVPANKALAPEHENMDKVFTFITED